MKFDIEYTITDRTSYDHFLQQFRLWKKSKIQLTINYDKLPQSSYSELFNQISKSIKNEDFPLFEVLDKRGFVLMLGGDKKLLKDYENWYNSEQ